MSLSVAPAVVIRHCHPIPANAKRINGGAMRDIKRVPVPRPFRENRYPVPVLIDENSPAPRARDGEPSAEIDFPLNPARGISTTVFFRLSDPHLVERFELISA